MLNSMKEIPSFYLYRTKNSNRLYYRPNRYIHGASFMGEYLRHRNRSNFNFNNITLLLQIYRYKAASRKQNKQMKNAEQKRQKPLTDDKEVFSDGF